MSRMYEMTTNIGNTIQGARVTMPSRLITDPKFKWRDSARTDVRRTFRKARLLMALQRSAA